MQRIIVIDEDKRLAKELLKSYKSVGENQKKGALAEAVFTRLYPDATRNPQQGFDGGFDFTHRGHTIDVKCTEAREYKGSRTLGLCSTQTAESTADYFAGFTPVWQDSKIIAFDYYGFIERGTIAKNTVVLDHKEFYNYSAEEFKTHLLWF